MTGSAPAVRLLVIVGSLRSASLNRQLAVTAIAHAPERAEPILFDRLGELPHYNEDLDVAPLPGAVEELRATADRCHAMLVVTPEYNGGLPGVLKNAIDWLSRPYGNSPIKEKPVGVIGCSLSQYGGAWAHADARKSLGIAGARAITDIELSIPAKMLNGVQPHESTATVELVRAAVQHLVDCITAPDPA